MAQIDYLGIGHISMDVTASGSRVGGTVAYAGWTALALGYQTAVLTSAAADFNCREALSGICTHHVPAEKTTVFENIYTSGHRLQRIHSRAERLFAGHVPPAWLHASIVHFAPIADEIDPEMIGLFNGSLIGFTPQGWMRSWNERGDIGTRNWPEASNYLTLASVVILSDEDLPDSSVLEQFRSWSPLLVITEGRRGCTVFYQNDIRHISTEPVREADPTGSGDIFAAAFMIRLHQNGGDPWEAARFANKIAGATVSLVGLEAKAARIKQVSKNNAND